MKTANAENTSLLEEALPFTPTPRVLRCIDCTVTNIAERESGATVNYLAPLRSDIARLFALGAKNLVQQPTQSSWWRRLFQSARVEHDANIVRIREQTLDNDWITIEYDADRFILCAGMQQYWQPESPWEVGVDVTFERTYEISRRAPQQIRGHLQVRGYSRAASAIVQLAKESGVSIDGKIFNRRGMPMNPTTPGDATFAIGASFDGLAHVDDDAFTFFSLHKNLQRARRTERRVFFDKW